MTEPATTDDRDPKHIVTGSPEYRGFIAGCTAHMVDPADQDPAEVYAPEVEAVIAALMPLGYEAVVVGADGLEPCASLDVGDGWLDVTVTFREDSDRG